MRKILNILFLSLAVIGFINAQFADPAVSGANFTTTSVNVGNQTNLVVSFVNVGSTSIPLGSIELTISAPFTYYSSDGVTGPSGSGAGLFDWVYLTADLWRGTNNVSIPGQSGGDIILEVSGISETSTFETTNINVQPVSNFNMFSDSPSNNNLQPGLRVDAAIASCPTPLIIGDLFGCGNDLLTIFVDTVTINNTYEWSVTGEAEIVSSFNGGVSVQLPDTTRGIFILSLTETNVNGCQTTTTAILTIEQNTSLVCDDNLNLSLNETCTLDITADMILEGQAYPNDSYLVEVSDMKGNVLPNMISGSNYIGETFIVSVLHECSGNSCWGHITLEDKIAPVINCPDDRTVSCFDKTVFAAPTAMDNCDASVPVVEVDNVIDQSNCTEDFSAKRTITYTAKDDQGNVAETCEAYIYYEFESIDSIKFPANLSSVDSMTYLPCDNSTNWDLNGDGYPQIDETGYPTLDGNKIFENNGLCKINSVFTDQRIDVCDQTFKIIREFTILDWCTGSVRTGTQIIKVLDMDGPIVTCPPDSLFNTTVRPYECLGNFEVPAPTVITDCSDSITYIVEYLLADSNGDAPEGDDIIYISDNVSGTQEDGYVISDLPLGRTWVRYTVTDGCGNFTYCFTEIDVLDEVPPIAICDQNTVVGITTVDFALVFAATFDDGSYDNCSEMTFEVARMRSGCGTGTAFGPSVVFCCDDIGTDDLMVQFKATDEAGNSNTCMVNVTVQDKAKPIITCPANITIDCEAPRDIASTGGFATAIDNCPGVEVILKSENESIDQCMTGSIRRTFEATDNSDQTASCSYTVTIINQTPFRERDINWASSVRDVTLDECTTVVADPDVTGRPTWTNDECSLVAATYEDEIFNVVDSVCLKILRTWTVIDWCTYNENTGFGKYSYVQAIKLLNTVKPDLPNCNNREVCVEGPGCGGDVELIIPATDDCTPVEALKFIYAIDLNDDGTIDRPGGTNDLSGYYEPGKHRVTIEVEDGCGNLDKCEFVLTVKDCKEPTPYCFTEITTVVMPSTGLIDIWASDFDNGSFDNCPGDLKFSFSASVSDTRAFFDCDDLGVNNLQMWVTDEAGNQDYCSVKVDIQANDDACEGTLRASGKVTTFYNRDMPSVDITLTNITANESTVALTNDDGEFTFFGLDSNSDYTISADKNTDPMNGVSTLDLVLIQRHILGISKLDSPYKYIAADVNGNKAITASDLVALRKLILGIDAKYASNTSWRFVDKKQVLPSGQNPFPFTETVSFTGSQLASTLDLLGVKIGDVNESCKVNLRDEDSGPRSVNPFNLVIDEVDYAANDVVKVDVKMEDIYSLFGFQNTFKFNESNLEFLGIESGELDIDESNIGLQKVKEGKVSASWSTSKYVDLDKEEVLFSIFFKATNNGRISDDLSITSDITSAEAYDASMSAEVIYLTFRSEDLVSSKGLKVYQNTPNPFINTTSIKFDLPKDNEVTLKVFDLSGRLIHNETNDYKQGTHTIMLDLSNKDLNGVLSYSIETSEEKIIKKMVIVK